MARSGVGFQRLTVNEFVAGSIPVSHLANIFGGKFLWEGSLIVYQVAGFKVFGGSTRVAIALKCAAFDYWLGRLLLRQQEGDRNSYAVLGRQQDWPTKRRGRF